MSKYSRFKMILIDRCYDLSVETRRLSHPESDDKLTSNSLSNLSTLSRFSIYNMRRV